MPPVISAHLIAAARPNFMKVAPLYHALAASDWCRPVLVHTGQHYDSNMSGAFLDDLGLPAPDHHLGVGSGSHAEQTAGVMVAYESILRDTPPDWVVVVGDVNSTLACSIAAKKLCLPVAHLEAGLRSGDRTMPEEINRVVTDAISDLYWTPSPDADENLLREGVAPEKIDRVGNFMIDSFELMRPRIEATRPRERFDLGDRPFAVVTLHRPSNVDRAESLGRLVAELRRIADGIDLVFPVHPRTRQRLDAFGLAADLAAHDSIHLIDPLGYVDFMGLVRESTMVVTDSGGIQEETTYLGIPCLTLRNTTERPITVTVGSNRLVKPEDLAESVDKVMSGAWAKGRRPDLWDGHTAERAAASLKRHAGA
ncbi:MAG: UDP-N-acetylglucosamine 2-epimerase (non-hydrolyzing) [Rhodospirillaceae bacterium]|nr:UDP-N-acetylglucosamine 2-epimerase (non-hydrolyzing) [Rhodospirillaceae bacterium]